MLNDQERAIVKATVPALRAHGETITRRFYSTMLTAHPELFNYFNPANQQAEGGQARSLAASVLTYAENIDRLGALGGMVERIAAKHVSLEILPEHYPIVGQHLLGAIAEVLGAAATPDILSAWGAAYGQLADIMIGREAALKKAAAEPLGGWAAFKPFRVSRKVPESKVMTSFLLEPEDGTPLPQFSPGQYVSVKVRPPGLAFDQIRQYSLSAAPNGHQLRISVKREDAPVGSSDIQPGMVSTFLHGVVGEGDTLLVHAPTGTFVLDESSADPVVLMSGGAGVTAVLGILQHLASNTDREVLWVHATRSREDHAFVWAVRALAASRSGIRCITLYETVGPDDVQGTHFDAVGRISAELLRAHLPAGNAEFYYCGPIGFMAATEHILDELGVAAQRRHTEAFAPTASFGVKSPSIEVVSESA
jgi:nitric oxide dioxygenase